MKALIVHTDVRRQEDDAESKGLFGADKHIETKREEETGEEREWKEANSNERQVTTKPSTLTKTDAHTPYTQMHRMFLISNRDHASRCSKLNIGWQEFNQTCEEEFDDQIQDLKVPRTAMIRLRRKSTGNCEARQTRKSFKK